MHNKRAPTPNTVPQPALLCLQFMTDRNSSRVLAPPGGKSSICFGNGCEDARTTVRDVTGKPGQIGVGVASIGQSQDGIHNNYSRPEGQNVGNVSGSAPAAPPLWLFLILLHQPLHACACSRSCGPSFDPDCAHPFPSNRASPFHPSLTPAEPPPAVCLHSS